MSEPMTDSGDRPDAEQREPTLRKIAAEALDAFADVLGYFTRPVHPGEAAWEAGFMSDRHRAEKHATLERLRAALRGPPLEAPPNDTARWLQGLREPLEAPGEPSLKAAIDRLTYAVQGCYGLPSKWPTLLNDVIQSARASALPLVHPEEKK